jgi:hypothetical protein
MSDYTPIKLKGNRFQMISSTDLLEPRTDTAKEKGREIGKSQCYIYIALFWGSKKKII